MLKPLAYAIWIDLTLRNQIFEAMHVTQSIHDIPAYCQWLVRRSGTNLGFINLVRLPIVLHHIHSSALASL